MATESPACVVFILLYLTICMRQGAAPELPLENQDLFKVSVKKGPYQTDGARPV